jgi:hypothetical protein
MKGSNDIAGATTASYAATSTGTYKVVVTNTQNGCAKSSNGIKVISNPLPAATITPSGPLSFCAGDSVVLQANTGTGLTYRWKKGSNYISGETRSNYTATTAGKYKVEVTNSDNCSKLSDAVTVSVPCKSAEAKMFSFANSTEYDVSIFPNPADFEINVRLSSDENFEIEIVNALGEKLISAKNQTELTFQNYPAGFILSKCLVQTN